MMLKDEYEYITLTSFCCFAIFLAEEQETGRLRQPGHDEQGRNCGHNLNEEEVGPQLSGACVVHVTSFIISQV